MKNLEPFDLMAGRWWRFDHYEIRDGYIRPAPGAELKEYDPWAVYRAGRAQGNGAKVPYLSLLELLDNKPTGEQRLYTLSPESEASVLSWCREFGLLGVLLQRTLSIVLAPRLERDVADADQDGLQNPTLVPTLRRYIRTNEGWQELSSFILGKGGHLIEGEAEREGELVSDDDVPKGWPKPSVLIQKLHNNIWVEEQFSETWSRFFPEMPNGNWENYSYPIPTSEEFWKLYAEPVDEFLAGVHTLSWAFDGLSHNNPIATASEKDEQSSRRGIKILNALVAPVSTKIIRLEDGSSFEQRWVAPSLLSLFAMMLLQDLTEKKRVLRCPVCGKRFLSDAYQARFCSDKCRYTAQKRRFRSKSKEKGHGQTRSE